ncbi:MAG: sensor histidine kinase [Actinomycetota bacterium]
MKLHQKLLVPLLAVFLAVVGYVYLAWIPALRDDAEAEVLNTLSHHLDSISEGLVPLMLASQIDVVHENMNALLATNPDWREVIVTDKAGRQIFPLIGKKPPPPTPDQVLHRFDKPVSIGPVELGRLTVVVDRGPGVQRLRQRMSELGVAFVVLALIMLVGAMVVLEGAVLVPVRRLALASKALARRDFSTPLPQASADEVGTLVSTFAEMRESRRETEQALQDKTAELERSNIELEQFAYVASHDLREPLRQVSSYVTLLERRYADKLDDEAREFIAFARDGAERMNQLIVDLLEYSRIGRIERPRETVVLRQVVDDAVLPLGVEIETAGAEVAVDASVDAAPPVPGYREELVRLLQNLVHNAVKYRRPDCPPRIAVSAATGADGVTVSVADNGIGIAPEHFERIFMIFQRLHTRAQYSGTGIGLAICKRIVEHHRGRIWLQSTPGQGSTFHVFLPFGDA